MVVVAAAVVVARVVVVFAVVVLLGSSVTQVQNSHLANPDENSAGLTSC